MKRLALVLLLVAGVAFAEEATKFAFFGRSEGRDWRGPVPLSPASLTLELEGPNGTLAFDAAKDADHYVVYLFEKAPPAPEKGKEDVFWRGEAEGFIAGVEVTPRPGATRFAIVEKNKRAWSVAYVYAVVAKERRLLKATWAAEKHEPGGDGFQLPNRYRSGGREK